MFSHPVKWFRRLPVFSHRLSWAFKYPAVPCIDPVFSPFRVSPCLVPRKPPPGCSLSLPSAIAPFSAKVPSLFGSRPGPQFSWTLSPLLAQFAVLCVCDAPLRYSAWYMLSECSKVPSAVYKGHSGQYIQLLSHSFTTHFRQYHPAYYDFAIQSVTAQQWFFEYTIVSCIHTRLKLFVLVHSVSPQYTMTIGHTTY